jgi:hypothetical protein
MADNPDPRPGEVAVAIPVNDVPRAPFIFYDAVPVSGHTNGVISLTLSANRRLPWAGRGSQERPCRGRIPAGQRSGSYQSATGA